MEGRVKWEDMATHCLVCIFMKLTLEDLTLGAPFVCKSWYQASLDPLCWRVVDLQQVNLMPWHKFSVSALLKFAIGRSCGLAVELRFPLCYRVSLADLAYVSNECPRLKVLALRSVRMEDQAHFPKIVGKWKELEHLEMASNPYSFSALVAEISLNCDKFRGLKMSGLGMEDALAIIKYLPKLKYLNLSGSYMHKGTLLLILNSCKEIEILIVKRCIGFEADKEIQEKASGMKVFRHEGSKLIDDYECDDGNEYYSPFYVFQACEGDEYRTGIRCLP